MFIITDPDSRDSTSAAQAIRTFYDHPEKQSLIYEMQRIGVYDKVQQYIQVVQKLQLSDFITNGKWTGITPEMDAFLPSVVCNGQRVPTASEKHIQQIFNYTSAEEIQKLRDNNNKNVYEIKHRGVFRGVNIKSSETISNITITTNGILLYSSQSPITNGTLDINIPVELCIYNAFELETDIHPDSVQMVYTLLPEHIVRQLTQMPNILVTLQGKDYSIINASFLPIPDGPVPVPSDPILEKVILDRADSVSATATA
jgi:hypothetical protein